jgi:ABC-2 type transport system permease protein
MSVSTATRPTIDVGTRLKHALVDATVATWRNLMQITRVPAVLVFELLQPIMFVLLFRYVYEHAFAAVLGGVPYVMFLMPGIFVQNGVFGSTTTAIGLAEDMKKGLVDRFRSLPMARSAVLVGRTSADLAKNFVLVMIMIGIGYLVGFRFQRGFIPAVGVVVLVMAIGFAFSWISACIGLALKEVEAVQAATFTWIFPVVFISAVFVPVQGMSSFMQAIARNNPLTYWAMLARYLSIGPAGIPPDPATGLPIETFEGLVIKSVLWIAGILVVFVPLAIRLYRRLD